MSVPLFFQSQLPIVKCETRELPQQDPTPGSLTPRYRKYYTHIDLGINKVPLMFVNTRPAPTVRWLMQLTTPSPCTESILYAQENARHSQLSLKAGQNLFNSFLKYE